VEPIPRGSPVVNNYTINGNVYGTTLSGAANGGDRISLVLMEQTGINMKKLFYILSLFIAGCAKAQSGQPHYYSPLHHQMDLRFIFIIFHRHF